MWARKTTQNKNQNRKKGKKKKTQQQQRQGRKQTAVQAIKHMPKYTIGAGLPWSCPAGRRCRAPRANGRAEKEQEVKEQSPSRPPASSPKTPPAVRGRTYLSGLLLLWRRQSRPVRSGRPNQSEILFSLHCP